MEINYAVHLITQRFKIGGERERVEIENEGDASATWKDLKVCQNLD
jgi:hypothetical protein